MVEAVPSLAIAEFFHAYISLVVCNHSSVAEAGPILVLVLKLLSHTLDGFTEAHKKHQLHISPRTSSS